MRCLTIAPAAVLLIALVGCGGGETPETTGGVRDERAASTQPDAPTSGIPPAQLERIVHLFNQGVGLMDRYEPVEAVAAFEEVVRLAPDWTTGRLNLGIALLNAQSDEYSARAETELKRVIADDPENPYAPYALGMLLRHLTRLDEAREQFARVLEIDPDDADAHYQLGILIIGSDPAAARVHLERTLEQIPHHESACYRLQTLLRQAGETERARELLLRFKALKSSGAGVFSGMKYGEMGHYAEVLRSFGQPPTSPETDVPLRYRDAARDAGLTHATGGTPGWPGEKDSGLSSGNPAGAFGPGVAVADVDGDSRLDVYIPGAGPESPGVLYLNQGETFRTVENSGIDGRDAVGAYFGDYDGDGDPDLFLTRFGPNRLYQNDGDARFTDVTQPTGTGGGANLSIGAAWADADHDGDLDLYVANFSAADAVTSGAPNALWRNNGDGTFTEVAATAGIDGGETASLGVLFLDVDDDRDLDLYLINHRAPNRLFLNQRIGRYVDATSAFPELAGAGPGLGAVLGDVDANGWEDILLLRGVESPRLFLRAERGRYVEDMAFAAAVRDLGGSVGGLLADLDLDGDLDCVLLGAGDARQAGHQILLNNGAGQFASPVLLGEKETAVRARGAVAVDFTGDGSLDLLVARAGRPPELWRAPAPAGRHWLEVIPVMATEDKTQWTEPSAIGLLVEVKTGRRLQVARVTSSGGYLGGAPRRVHFGLGASGKADYVRLSWPDAVLQSELEVAANQPWRITKVMRKPSSCPILFAWDGERFAFVTDFLGVGGLGFFIAPGEYAPPDPTEDVRIPPDLIASKDGRYLLRIAEPLEEVTYFDELHLIAYDHPAAWEVYPDERFTGSAPFPTGRPYAVADKIFPVAARDYHGNDIRARVLTIDRHYAEPPRDPRFVGYADDHWIELNFGNRLQNFDPDARLVLYLYGWVEYTYSHVNYAAYQARLTMTAPSIEVPDGKGGWRVAVQEMGFPAGLPRMMTYDISSLSVREDGRMRIRTNMEIFWDQVFVAEDVAGSDIGAHKLQPQSAELRHMGYPREYSPDGADPTLYDYHRIDHGVPFKNLAGSFTRFGDVRELLGAVDDRFVIMARGEEIALEFDADQLPALRDGWSRTFVLHSDGYCKDMDLYTAYPATVEPLPYHGMENYPPASESPSAGDRQSDQEAWNTRTVAGSP